MSPMKKIKMTILVSEQVRNKLHEIQFQSLKDGNKKSLGKIIEILLQKAQFEYPVGTVCLDPPMGMTEEGWVSLSEGDAQETKD